MSLTTGTKLGPYEIVAPLGAGGMGEVYRARDTKLNRDVALKVLLDSVVNDPERVARFTREAHVLASLNHPHIAHLYGFEEGATSFLVMELVEGPTLADLINDQRRPAPAAAGPSESASRGTAASGGGAPRALDIADVLAIARQIAEALEAAHELGIVHRDLKPANVKVRDDGVVKVLDFGLAKALDVGRGFSPGGPAGAEGPAYIDPANSPTLTARATQLGMILGTAAYMAPEQAKGKPVDKRADVWAFGVVVYEMLTGRRLFDAEDVSETMAAVLRQEISLAGLPATTPPRLRRLIGRCLERDPKQRLRDIGEARIEIARIEAGGADVTETTAAAVAAPPPAAATRRRVFAAASVMLLVGLAVAATWLAARPASKAEITRTSLLPPPGTNIFPDSAAVAISPDGTMVAFVVGDPQSFGELWVRDLDSLAARRLEGTEAGSFPFWSTDSTQIGFFTPDKVKRVAVAPGARAETICSMPYGYGRGGSWNRSNVIVFGWESTWPLYRVSANGGEATPVTTIDAARNQIGHRFPVFLPDGDHFLYAALPAREGKYDIFAGSLGGATSTFIGSMEGAPVYADPGWLLYTRQGVLAAQPFDARALRVTGEAVSLADAPTSYLGTSRFTAGPTASVSLSGSLAYFSSPPAYTTATWIDTTGKPGKTMKLPVGQYYGVRISPDGTHAVFVRATSTTDASLWLGDLAIGGAVPFSSGGGWNDSPVWSHDSKKVVFANDGGGLQDFYVKNVADTSPEQPLYQSPVPFKNPDAWSSDDHWIVFSAFEPKTGLNLLLLPVSGSGTPGQPKPYLRGPQRDYLGLPSPDGRWLAYVSNDTGRDELYVQSFPEPGPKQQVSTDGVWARWWKDSRHLLFLSPDKTLWSADVDPGATLKVTTPVHIGAFPSNIVAVDMMPDGSGFLALIPERAGTGAVTVVRNWRAALETKR